MPKTYNVQKNRTENKLDINHLENFYLRLYAHGMNSQEISEFLGIDMRKANRIRSNIYGKFKTKNWIKIIGMAFEHKHLNKLDFVDPNVKLEALAQVQILLDDDTPQTAERKNRYISSSPAAMREELLRYYLKAKATLLKNYNARPEVDKLTTQEIDLIKLKFNGSSADLVRKKMRLSEPKFRQLKKEIFRKLDVKNWLNVYRKCLQINILNKSESYFVKTTKSISNCATKIARVQKLETLNPNEKKDSMYTGLLDLYAEIENNSLFNVRGNHD